MNALICPSCGAREWAQFVNFGAVPYSGTFLDAPDRPVTLRPLVFDFCGRCGLIRQRPAPNVRVDYTEVGRRTERQLPEYVAGIVSALCARTEPTASLVIEVGANDGTFLNYLAKAGFKRRVAIEPSRPLARICESAGHVVENVHLNEIEAHRIRGDHGPARAVICRHTLEHVPDPLALLRAMRELVADDGALFIEVPGTNPVVEQLFGFELWDEHLTYFSQSNLAQLLVTAGYSIAEMGVLPHRGSQNIFCWATPRVEGIPQGTPYDAVLVAQCRRFASRWQAYSEHMLAQAAQWPRPILAAGASHLQSNFLLFTGLGSIVEGLIDDDPVKSGRWVPLPQPVEVFPTSLLVGDRMDGGTILLTGFGYPSWMRRVSEEAHKRKMIVLDPVQELSRF